MPARRLAIACAVCLLALAAGCHGCADLEEMAEEETTGEELDEGEYGVEGGVSIDLLTPMITALGEEDRAGRYPSTVWLRVVSAPEGVRYRPCIGVLIASNVVLTAAHCVCTPSGSETIRFDSSKCAAKAEVHFRYKPHHIDSEATYSRLESISGDIVAHPLFELVLDAQGAVTTSRADLALIRLMRPISSDVSPVRLATRDVKTGEELSVVGYGYLDGGGIVEQVRMLNREATQTLVGGDRFVFGPMDRADYKGDMGGPCLRETGRAPELVGISQRGLGPTPTFTRVVPYRDWLEEQIRLAKEKP